MQTAPISAYLVIIYHCCIRKTINLDYANAHRWMIGIDENGYRAGDDHLYQYDDDLGDDGDVNNDVNDGGDVL